MQNPSQRYAGSENLEVMREAVNYNAFLQSLVRRFASNTAEVLDFGAGIGTFSGTLEVPPDRLTCIEPDSDARASLTARGYEVHSGLDEIADGRFTYIYSLNVLEHIEDDGKTVSELYRVLRPGGRLFVYVPAFNLLFSVMDAKVGHFRRYDMKGMAHILKSAGFIIEKLAYTDALGYFAALAYKVIRWQSEGVLDKTSVRFYDRWLFPLSRMLSLLLAGILGKNLYAVASKPALADGALVSGNPQGEDSHTLRDDS